MRVRLGSAALAARAVEAVATSDRSVFTELGRGAARVALLGPDGIVYKVPINPAYPDQFHAESHFFGLMDTYSVPYCPDFWPYEEHAVMAMRRYRQSEVVPPLPLMGDVLPEQFGWDGDRPVLLDGGSITFCPGTGELLHRQAFPELYPS